ncbi:hypothetical protein ACO1O0_001118 [Amphichorda felina]
MSAAPTSWTPGDPDKRLGSNAKRFKEDTEVIRARLADQSFDMKKYRDPLLPRDTDRIPTLPRGVTPEMEKKWLTDIAAAKKKREQAGQ